MNNPKETKVSPELTQTDLVFGESPPFQQMSYHNSFSSQPLTPTGKVDKHNNSFFVGDRTQATKGYSYSRKMYQLLKT